MRKIGIPEIEDIATGAALLGAGGGGDPYVGKLVAIGAVQEPSRSKRARNASCSAPASSVNTARPWW